MLDPRKGPNFGKWGLKAFATNMIDVSLICQLVFWNGNDTFGSVHLKLFSTDFK